MQVLRDTYLETISQGYLPKIGVIDFVNCMPVILPLARKVVNLEADLVYGTPAELNKLFKEHLLQIGAISSHFYLTTSELELIPALSISSQGPTGSVLLFTKRRLEEADCARIAVPNCSATSTNLLKILLREEYSLIPDMVSTDYPQIERSEFDGALVIGDYALKVDCDWTSRYRRLDLGEWWNLRYGLPMVFGVWVADKRWCETNNEAFQAICHSLKSAIEIGLTSMFDEVVREAQVRTGLGEGRIRSYFLEELDFAFGAKHAEGLEKYRVLCKRHGLINP